MLKYIQLFLLLIGATFILNAQNVEGIVTDEQGEGLIGAEVYWLNTSNGVITNLDGEFSIPRHATEKCLVISYLSFVNDTLTVGRDDNSLYIILKEDSKSLDEVVVSARAAGTVSSRYTPFQTQTISGKD